MHIKLPRTTIIPNIGANLGAYAVLAYCLIAAMFATNAEAGEISKAFNSLPLPNWMVVANHLAWKLPPMEYAVGVFFGLALALLSVYRFAANKAASKALLLEDSFSRYSHTRALLTNGFVWVYVLLVVGFAGLIYSGVFSLLRNKIEENMPAWVSWGPAGASVILTFTWTLLSRNFSWFKADSGVQLEKVVDDLEKHSSASDKKHWVQTIAWSSLESDCDTKITELAYLYSVGLIRHAVQSYCESAIDRGRIDPEDIESLIAEIGAVPSGSEDRERFVARRQVIQIASKIVPLEALEQTIKNGDRRTAERRGQHQTTAQPKERRRDIHRRVDGVLIPEAA